MSDATAMNASHPGAAMTDVEKTLLILLKHAPDSNTKAVLLQSFIATQGPLSEEAAAEARKLLALARDLS
jgi:hypothetical protein